MEHRSALAMVALTACAQDASPFLSISCDQTIRLTPRADVEYVQLRRLSAGFNYAMLTQGTPCAAADCAAALARLEQYSTPESYAPCLEFRCPEQMYAIAVRGGRAELLRTPAELRELVGGIDTADEAWLLATASAHANPLVCDLGDAPLPVLSSYRRHNASFELRELRYTKQCPLTLSERFYEVALDGTVTASEPVEIVEDACVVD